MVHIARQPILDLERQVFGYELLYRNTTFRESVPDIFDGDRATRTVISDSITTFGIDKLTNKGTAFINFTKELIMGEVLSVIDPHEIVVELLEDIVVDEAFIKRIKYWYELGYRFAVDDYDGGMDISGLIPYIDIIKVDFQKVLWGERERLTRSLKKYHKQLLAEKVETAEDYSYAAGDGYTLFQGYYLERPEVLNLNLPNAQNMTCMRVFDEASNPELDFDSLSEIVRMDMALSYKLLHHVGTLQYYRGTPILDIKDALVRMGVENVRRWMLLIFLREVLCDESSEMIRTALIRAVFSEKIASRMKLGTYISDAYFCGLFSVLGETNGVEELLESIVVSQKVKEALLEQKGILYQIVQFVKDYQTCQWDTSKEFLVEHDLYDDSITMDYLSALQIADETFGYTD